MTIELFVPGIPKPGGSKRAFFTPKTRKAVVVDACDKNRDWRAAVAATAHEAMKGKELLRGPLDVGFHFYMPRPKGHYNKHGVKESAPRWHSTRPDATKLVRSTEDALTGIVWLDDAQVAIQRATKSYSMTPGAGVVITEIKEDA
jgi:Holliday junction resolvase RusA-like endonuclease